MKIKNKTNLRFILLTMLTIFCVPNVSAAEWNLCTQSGPLKIFKIVGIALNIMKICVPLLIIIMGSIDLAKIVISGDDKDVKESTTKLVKRVVAGIIVFFVPTIIFYVLGLINNMSSFNTFNNCNTCIFKVSGCDSLISDAENEENVLNDQQKTEEEIEATEAAQKSAAASENAKAGRTYTGDNSGNTSTDATKYSGYIFMGDSRTVAYQENNLLADTDSVHGKVGGKLSDLTNTDWPALKSDLEKNKDKNYVIVFNYGVNDLDANSYVSKYNEIFSGIHNINSNNKIVVVSVNPVDNSKSKFAKNDKITAFNSTIKSGISGASYCDMYSVYPIENPNPKEQDFKDYWLYFLSEDGEGVHYTANYGYGYKKIMDYIKTKC